MSDTPGQQGMTVRKQEVTSEKKLIDKATSKPKKYFKIK